MYRTLGIFPFHLNANCWQWQWKLTSVVTIDNLVCSIMCVPDQSLRICSHLSFCLSLNSFYAVSQKKQRHPTHVDNFAKNWSIFNILSLMYSEQNFLQNKYCIAHHTLQMLLHYLVKLQCFKNRLNSKIHYRRTLFWSIFADVPA